MRRTKIIATIGPKTRDVESIKKIITAGADAIRINFSHDTREAHAETAKNVMEAREALGAPTALVLDTKGPEIRTGVLAGDTDIQLVAGGTIVLTTDEIEGTIERVSVTYADLAKDLEVGSRVLVDDGLIELKVTKIEGNDLTCEIINGGLLGSRKGINIPDVFVNLPALTEKDILDIEMGVKVGFDYIAASFIRCKEDVLQIREVLKKNGGEKIKIISKIENRDGVNNIDEILEVTDGIMVARGDLGVEIPAEEVPLVQKMLIQKSNELGIPVVTATQMLESMVKNPRPTRAEASDVANAVYDGTSAIMLSGETAKGDYPYEAIQFMDRTARTVESRPEVYHKFLGKKGKVSMTNAISYSACTAAKELNAAAIVTVTKSGYTARSLSKYKPASPIIAYTLDPQIERQLNLVWGCQPKHIDLDKKETDEVFAQSVAQAEKEGFVKKDDIVVLTAGVPIGVHSTTNVLKVQYV
ncbi:MAG: pyruvate kinase [Epulopiscium sp. Nele67-Bin005]|nr:MAG: pyruvate kinase [Epulopiscium sp. Nele67-Bin005]